jgi:hypothetical protein
MKLNIAKIQEDIQNSGLSRYRLNKDYGFGVSSLTRIVKKGESLSFLNMVKLASVLKADIKDWVINE